MLLPSGGGRLTESGGNLVKCPALRLRHFEVGEDEEEEQQHGEDDEDVGAARVLRGADEREEQLRGGHGCWIELEQRNLRFLTHAFQLAILFQLASPYWKHRVSNSIAHLLAVSKSVKFSD